MADLGRLGFILVSLFTRMYFSTAYESGSLCMYHAMTFYESFGLEVAYKIIKRKLASRVYVFTNLTQVWSGDETVKYNDQIFMLIIGRTAKKDSLFENLENVNYQTGFELIGEQIIDGNVPYLDWASSYIPISDTTTPKSTTLSDTNEAFTFRENFIHKKYGTHAPNQTTFPDSNLKLTTNSSPPTTITQRQELTTYQNSYARVSKGDNFPPNITFPDLEAEKDRAASAEKKSNSAIRESYDTEREADNTIREPDNTMDKKEELYIRENQRLIREQRAWEARRNFRRRQKTYNERNLARMYPKMRQQRYVQQNPSEMYDRVPPRYFEQQNAPDWYDRDIPRYEEQTEPDWIENNLPRYFERGNARKPYERDEPENDEPNTEDWECEERAPKMANAGQNLYRNRQRPVWSNSAKTSRSSGIMDIIKSFINPFVSKEEIVTDRAKKTRRNFKVGRKPRARKINEDYQPNKFIYDTNDYENLRNYEWNNPVNHRMFVQRAGYRDLNYGQKQRNERRTMRSRRSRVRRNERQAPRVRQTIRVARAGKANWMGNPLHQHQMNYAHEMNHRENNAKYHYAPPATDTYQHEHVFDNHEPINIHDSKYINNYHVASISRPQAGNDFAHFHQINEAADHLNELTRLHKMAKGHKPPPYHNVWHDHQYHPIIHANPPRLHAEQFADHDEVLHIIKHQHKQYQPYRAPPVYNPNNLPVLHKAINRQPYHMIHSPEVIHLQVDPRSRIRKTAPRVRKSKANPRAARAKKFEMAPPFYQHTNPPQAGVHTTIQYVDVLQYHYEPRENMRMIQ